LRVKRSGLKTPKQLHQKDFVLLCLNVVSTPKSISDIPVFDQYFRS
jgi:hypothetical protein